MPSPRVLVAVMLLSGAALAATGAPPASSGVGPPPASLGLDPFYAKYLDAGGIPVVSSAKVEDSTLQVARELIDGMLAERPDLRRSMVADGVRVGVMAIDESTTDLPEQRHWKKPAPDDPRLTPCERKHYDRIAAMSDREYWDSRARGMGGRYTTGAEENLRGIPDTRYFGENILVHELAHAVLYAVQRTDPALYRRVEEAYRNAMEAGLWRGDYAAVTVQEYWAEGTQFWFNSNKLSKGEDREVLSADDLRAYDPALYAVLGEVYSHRQRLDADVYYRHPARSRVPARAAGSDC